MKPEEREKLEQRREEFQEQLRKGDALVLAVIKGHLLVEQMLDGLITTFFFYPEELDGLSFSRKAHLCRAICLGNHGEGAWKVLWEVNSLRNKIAHGLRADEVGNSMARLRTVYLAQLSAEQSKGVPEQPNGTIAMMACSYVGAFLGAMQDRAKVWRRLIEDENAKKGGGMTVVKL